MTTNEIVNIVVSILSGLCVCIPLVVKLIDTVKKTVREKNWAPTMQLILKLMVEAEKLYEKGADKKEYVMSAIREMASSLEYDIDEDVINAMIDSICDASKNLNINSKNTND